MNAHGRAEEEQVTGQLNHSGGLQGHTFVSMYAEKNLLRRTAFLITVPGKIIGSFFLPYCASCGKVRKYILLLMPDTSWCAAALWCSSLQSRGLEVCTLHLPGSSLPCRPHQILPMGVPVLLRRAEATVLGLGLWSLSGVTGRGYLGPE